MISFLLALAFPQQSGEFLNHADRLLLQAESPYAKTSVQRESELIDLRAETESVLHQHPSARAYEVLGRIDERIGDYDSSRSEFTAAVSLGHGEEANSGLEKVNRLIRLRTMIQIPSPPRARIGNILQFECSGKSWVAYTESRVLPDMYNLERFVPRICVASLEGERLTLRYRSGELVDVDSACFSLALDALDLNGDRQPEMLLRGSEVGGDVEPSFAQALVLQRAEWHATHQLWSWFPIWLSRTGLGSVGIATESRLAMSDDNLAMMSRPIWPFFDSLSGTSWRHSDREFRYAQRRAMDDLQFEMREYPRSRALTAAFRAITHGTRPAE